MSTTDGARALDSELRNAEWRMHRAFDDVDNLCRRAEDLGIHNELGYPSWAAYRDDACPGYDAPASREDIVDIPIPK